MSGPTPHAVDRAALLMQLVPYLVSKGEVSIADAAAEFGVSPTDMRAMVGQLTMVGLPGDGGFWQMPHELFDVDWDLLEEQGMIAITNAPGLERAPRLTAREAAALLAGLQLAASLPGVGQNGVVQGLLAKLGRGASSTPADVIVAPEPVDAVRTAVADALTQAVAVSFRYRAPDAEATTRTVDPVKVHISSGQWYLQGWCHLRQGMRTFHLDRVSDLSLTDIPITHGAEGIAAPFGSRPGNLIVTVRYPRAVASVVADYLDRAEVTEDAGVLSAEIPVADPQSLKRLAARGGGAIEIVSPASARSAAAAWAAAGLAQYR